MKKFIIFTAVSIMSGNLIAQRSLSDHNDQWLLGENPDGGTQGIGAPGGGDPTVGDTPIGDGVFILSALAAGYAMAKRRKKQPAIR
jgi:hypothetical protein